MQFRTWLTASALLLALHVSADAAQNQGDGKQGQTQNYATAPAGFDAKRDGIEHGKTETIDYESKVSGGMRKMVVYTPPGYSKDGKYPVLYLLHGIGGDHNEWPRGGVPNIILDNLYAQKKAVPMIVVMPNGRTTGEGPGKGGGKGGNAFQLFGDFDKNLLGDIIPYVESHYSVKADRENRALAGLSMGGGQSLNFGLNNLGTFAWVGGFSSAPNTKQPAGLIKDHAEAAQKLRLLWVSCGDQDGLMKISLNVHNMLEEKKVPHIWSVIPGGKHDFKVWKNDLYHFSQLIFQDQKAPAQGAAKVGVTKVDVSKVDVTGAWIAEFDTQVGLQKYSFTLKQDGAAVSGKASVDTKEKRDVTFKEGKIEGDKLTLVELLTIQGNEVRVTFTGKVSANEIKFTRQVGDFGSSEATAKRVVASDPAKSGKLAPAKSGTLGAAPKGFDTKRENIERGKIEAVEYDSKTVAGKRKMTVYTAPGYAATNKYPVFYLLHGGGDDETGWREKGAADIILDNLYADKKIVPMIVVMPNGFVNKAGEKGAKVKGGGSLFEDDLLKDIIPYVESHYSTRTSSNERALAGLSMGAGQTLNIGLKHPDKFAWIGAFSGGGKSANLSDQAALKKLRLFWISSGDKDQLAFAGSESLHNTLTERNIPHVWHVDSGGHTWPVWKNDLYLISQMLFRDIK